MKQRVILAFVGMPGAGKTEAADYLKSKKIPFIRFGQLTDDRIKKIGLPLTTENERKIREEIRKENGMAAYAVLAKPKILEMLKGHDVIAIDGLYSWEEYVFLKKEFENLVLIYVFAEPTLRYKRLSERPVRPVAYDKCYERDFTEIENLNKGGPIAIADYLVENNGSLDNLHKEIDSILLRLDLKQN